MAVHEVAKALRLLGMGNIDRDNLCPGAIEGLAISVKEAGEAIADGLGAVADAIDRYSENHTLFPSTTDPSAR